MTQQSTVKIGGHDATHVLTTAFYVDEDYKPKEFAKILRSRLYSHDGQEKGAELPGWYELTFSNEVTASEVSVEGDRYGTMIEVRYALAKGAEPHEIDHEILYVIEALVEEIKSARIQEELLNALA